MPALLETYAVNDAMNQLLLAYLKPQAWRAQLPGSKRGGRTIAPSSLTSTTAAWSG